jgi:hypothetical protein
MTTYSKQTLRDSALEEIKVKDAGTTMDTLDTDAADREIQTFLEYLEDESLLIFDASVGITTANIPGRIWLALRDAVAELIAPKYSMPTRMVPKPGGGQESMYDNALRRLRRSVMDGSDDVPVKACYF